MCLRIQFLPLRKSLFLNHKYQLVIDSSGSAVFIGVEDNAACKVSLFLNEPSSHYSFIKIIPVHNSFTLWISTGWPCIFRWLIKEKFVLYIYELINTLRTVYCENVIKTVNTFDIRRSEDRASWYSLIMKANELHCFSNLFDKVLYMFWTDLLSIIRSISTLYTRNTC